MKKLLLLSFSILCILTLVYAQSKLQSSNSLKDIYFKAISDISLEETLSKGDLAKLLKDYSYEQGTTTSDGTYDCVETPYIYKDGNEKLVVNEHAYEDGIDVSVEYQVSSNNDLLCFAFNEHNASSYVALESDDIGLHFNVAKILQSSDTNLMNIYYNLSESVASSEKISLDSLKQLTELEPLVESDSDINIYTFSQDKEMLRLYCLKDSNKAVKVVYGNDDANEKLTTIGKSMLDDDREISTSIKSLTSDVEVQQKIMDKVIK